MDSEGRNLFRLHAIKKMGVLFGSLLFLSLLPRHLIAPFTFRVFSGALVGISALYFSSYLATKYKSSKVPALVLVLSMFYIAFNTGLANGGILAPVTFNFILLPIVGSLAGGRRCMYIGAGLSTLGILLLIVLEQLGHVLPLQSYTHFSLYKSWMYFVGVLMSIAVGYSYEKARRETVEELTRQQDLLLAKSKMAALGEMSAGIAHEINNPLGIIVNRIEYLLKLNTSGELDKERINTDLRKINHEAKRIADIITSMTNYARDGSKDTAENVRLNVILDEVLILCLEKFRFHGIDLRVNVGNAHDLLINVNPTEIQQILINLFNNAFDAVKDHKEKWIEISVEVKDDKVVLSVKDSGRGIPPDLRAKIMEPFFTTKERGKGTGLGLSISRGIVEKYGGKLYINDNSEHTHFVAELPILGRL